MKPEAPSKFQGIVGRLTFYLLCVFFLPSLMLAFSSTFGVLIIVPFKQLVNSSSLSVRLLYARTPLKRPVVIMKLVQLCFIHSGSLYREWFVKKSGTLVSVNEVLFLPA